MPQAQIHLIKLSIVIDSVSITISLPADKILELSISLKQWSTHKKAQNNLAIVINRFLAICVQSCET